MVLLGIPKRVDKTAWDNPVLIFISNIARHVRALLAEVFRM